MPMFIAPLAGVYSDRIGSRPLMATGLALQAIALGWLALVSAPDVAYSSLIVPFALAGIGMALVFAPVSNMILSSVRPSEEGKASGASSAIREVGGALGVAVLASVFARQGDTLTGQGFVDGLVPAVWVGAGVLAAGALLALVVPGRRPQRERPTLAERTAEVPSLQALDARGQRIVSTKGALGSDASAATRARRANCRRGRWRTTW